MAVRSGVRQVIEDHLTPQLRSGRLALREVPGTGGAEAVLISRLVRVEVALADGVLEGWVRSGPLEDLPAVPLDAAIGVFGLRVPDGRDHAGLLLGLVDDLERLEDAAQTRESWLLLLERSDLELAAL